GPATAASVQVSLLIVPSGGQLGDLIRPAKTAPHAKVNNFNNLRSAIVTRTGLRYHRYSRHSGRPDFLTRQGAQNAHNSHLVGLARCARHDDDAIDNLAQRLDDLPRRVSVPAPVHDHPELRDILAIALHG